MAIAPDDLLQPAGRLDLSWFGGQSEQRAILERLDGYVTDAETRAGALTHLTSGERDEAAKAWAYHRAFEYLHITLQRTPASMGVSGEANRQYLQSQLNAFGQQSDRALAEWTRLATPSAADVSTIPRSSASPNTFVW